MKITYKDISKLKRNDLLLISIERFSNEQCLCIYHSANVQMFCVNFLAGISKKEKFDPGYYARSSYKDGFILFNKNSTIDETPFHSKVTKINYYDTIK